MQEKTVFGLGGFRMVHTVRVFMFRARSLKVAEALVRTA